MDKPKLSLQILNGPLDGQEVILIKETSWTKSGSDELSFPWEEELGTPQAKFFSQDGKWYIEGHEASHGTYCLNQKVKILEKMQVKKGDLLVANKIFLKIL